MKPEVFQKVTQFLQGLTFLSLFSPSFRVAPPWTPTSQKRFDGARTLLDYGFATYTVSNQVTAGDNMGTVPVEKGITGEVGAIAAEGYSALLKRGSTEAIEKEIDWYENITAPINAGDKVGTLKITQNGETLAEIDLNAASEVKKKGIGDFIRELLLSVFFGI